MEQGKIDESVCKNRHSLEIDAGIAKNYSHSRERTCKEMGVYSGYLSLKA